MKNNIQLPNLNNCRICIIGLGYVGLPLAIEFSKFKQKKSINHDVIGYDINLKRINELKNNIDSTEESSIEDLMLAKNLKLTHNVEDLYTSDVFIVTVPTPVDNANIPDLKALKSASKLVGETLKKRKKNISKNKLLETQPVIIYESTVYPGATKEVCIPIIQEASELNVNKDFFYGYSPERVNPGDKNKKLTSIVKITSGSTEFTSKWIDELYNQIIKVGTHRAGSVEIAEAAKIIENVQRDINIALINELSMIFSKLNLDTYEILEASKTKWNFIPFEPGLVGGHCIGIDPYYLKYKANLEGLYPQIVSSGRRINENMSFWIADRIITNISKRNLILNKATVLCLGITFKANCPDIRNTKVISLLEKLLEFNIEIDVMDPYVNHEEIKEIKNFNFIQRLIPEKKYSCVLLAVAHDNFKLIKVNEWKNMLAKDGFFFDIKNIIPRELNPVRI